MSLHLTSPNNIGAVRNDTSNLLMCNKWWRVCFTYGDQYKQYRHLYSKKTRLATLRKEEDKESEKNKDEKKKEAAILSQDGIGKGDKCCHLWDNGQWVF
ncbi:Protein prickle [Portunus trituberculatus]|uniref:Protein prickle n=1 Tax=Portunus trituberculatus TaxID=210409 RepID=A0A5B7H2H6_PORTR|nr:Protein prickle [Portunus trituberculatus]